MIRLSLLILLAGCSSHQLTVTPATTIIEPTVEEAPIPKPTEPTITKEVVQKDPPAPKPFSYPDSPIENHIRLDNVLVIDNQYNDADSFFAIYKGERYHFRLTGVDAPETNQRYPDRVRDQAEAFGLGSNAEAVAVGKEAKRWFDKMVIGKEVTIWTRWRQTGGRRTIPRYYCFMKIDGRWLSEILAEKRFVRVFGIEEDRPDGVNWEKCKVRLRNLGAY